MRTLSTSQVRRTSWTRRMESPRGLHVVPSELRRISRGAERRWHPRRCRASHRWRPAISHLEGVVRPPVNLDESCGRIDPRAPRRFAGAASIHGRRIGSRAPHRFAGAASIHGRRIDPRAPHRFAGAALIHGRRIGSRAPHRSTGAASTRRLRISSPSPHRVAGFASIRRRHASDDGDTIGI